jgi:hypothetical protein
MFRIWCRRQAKSKAQLFGFGRPGTRSQHGQRYLAILELLEDRALPSFLPGVNYDVGGSPLAVAAADLTGTGRLDLVTTNGNPSTVGVLLGTGDGTFQSHANYSVDANRGAVDVGDLTGNGIADLVVTNYASNGTVSVLLGNGDGTVRLSQTFSAGVLPTDVAVADLNGDGIPDLVTANETNQVNVFLGNGDGTFQAPVAYAAGAWPVSVTVADLTGNGTLDLVVADAAPLGGTAGVSILMGNGDGTFQAPVVYRVTGFPQYVEVGDFNGDGIPDLVSLNLEGAGLNSTLSFFQGNGDGSFRPPVSYLTGGIETYGMAAGDFNGDGNLDVAVTDLMGRVIVLLGNGDGSFQAPQSYSAGLDPSGVTAGDFNGDGSLDLAVANAGDNTVSVFINANDWSAPARDTAALKTTARAGTGRAAAVADALAGMPTEAAFLPQAPALEARGSELANVDHVLTSPNGSADAGRSDKALAPAASGDLTAPTVNSAETQRTVSGNTEITDLAFVPSGLCHWSGAITGAEDLPSFWANPW